LYRLLSGFKTGGDTLNQILVEHGMQDKVLPDSIHDCRRTITLITDEIKKLEKQSAYQRSEEQVQRAAIYDSTGRKDNVTLIREIRNSEQMTETYRLFHYIRKEKDTSGLTKIEVTHDWPDPHTPFEDVGDLTDPKQYGQQPDPQ
jgi:ABC-type lipoprotein export system ATPase subunit